MSFKKNKPQEKQNKWMLLIVMSLVGFIMFLDTTMMNVSISAVVVDLGTTVAALQSAIALFALVMAAFMITGSKMGEMYGLKKMFVIGMIMYAIGTTSASLAPNMAVLTIGWSLIEGLAVSILLPISTILITLNYVGKDRAKALGVFAAVGSAAGALGPIYGGLMTTYLSWRLAFASELIIVFIVFMMLKFVTAPEPKKGDKKLDLTGTGLLASGLVLFILGVTWASQYGWWNIREPFYIFGIELNPFGLSIVPFVFALSSGFFAIFARHEARVLDRGDDPLVNIKIFKNSKFNFSAIVGSVLMLVTTGILFVVPVFLQKGFGYNAIETGVALLPMSLSLMVFAILASPLGSKYSPRSIVQAGLLVMLLGVLALLRNISVEMSTLDLILGLGLFGAGVGIITSQITNLAMSSVNKDLTTEASGVNNTLRQLGTAMGTALIGATLLTAMSFFAAQEIKNSDYFSNQQKNDIIEAVNEGNQEVNSQTVDDYLLELPGNTIDEIRLMVIDSNVKAMKVTLMVVVLFLLISAILSIKLPKEKFVD